MCLYEHICFKKVAPTNSMSSTVILDVAGCWFHPRDPEKSTKHDFEHKNGNDTFVVVKLRSYSTKIKILQYESIFFSPKPISKLLVTLIQFLVHVFLQTPISSWRFSNDFLLHPKKVCQGPTDTTLIQVTLQQLKAVVVVISLWDIREEI